MLIERFKAWMSPGRVEQPTDTQQWVLCNYNFVIGEIISARDAKKIYGDEFMADKHAESIKDRVVQLTDVVLGTIEKYKSEFLIPQYVEVTSGDVNYFYYTKSKTLKLAEYEGARTAIGAGLFPGRGKKPDIPDGVWCSDWPLVTKLADNIVGLLSPKTSQWILANKRVA